MGKRANGEGTIYYDQSRSCWRGEISDESGRKRKITAATKKDAAAKLGVLKSEIANGREACALTWSSIDFGNQTISVTRCIRKENGVNYLSDQLKTRKARRSLSASSSLLKLLEEHQKTQAEQREFYGDLWPKEFSDVVFLSAAGTLIDGSNLRRKLKKITGNIGLGNWCPNELRHTNITLMSDAGISAEQVADHAGHTSTRMVETVYRHKLTNTNDAARRGLSNLGFE